MHIEHAIKLTLLLLELIMQQIATIPMAKLRNGGRKEGRKEGRRQCIVVSIPIKRVNCKIQDGVHVSQQQTRSITYYNA